ncbi:NUDIX hydrolase [Marmoricola endophyticus]|uniref:NUDIX hydrolase n=1 Tax=Marmoricola endophyticus TaxID=2040280 RepID=A0A917BG14_9ACTN|nr:NUDIX domain-containing protein [Marmoricola endophyticus]GGF41501.1 NUDIX hydrolase [Marmoricola endophyticus]
MPADAAPAGLREDALAVLHGWTPPDEEQDRLRDQYLAHLRRHRDERLDGLVRDPEPDHLTASVAVLSADRTRVLLTLHRKARRWFQLGGHLEPADATLRDAALREATEESGIAGLEVTAAPVRLDLHPVPFCHADGTARHLDVQYAAHAPAGAAAEVSAESLDLRWWPVDDLPSDEESLHRLVERALG